jgi:DNA-binding NarL/FixJ family response regulator
VEQLGSGNGKWQRMLLRESFPDIAIVGEASSGEEALQYIEAWLPDVVVMDVLMPGGIDGIETTRRVRLLTPHTQVVALTSAIDDALVISGETVKTHVGNILTKLQLAHRTQAIIYALKRGLITLDEIDM